MNTKYGEIPCEIKESYKEKLVGRIFKILPMREECDQTLDAYMKSLLFELVGNGKLISDWGNSAEFLMLLGTLEGLIEDNTNSSVRSEIFKSMVFKSIDLVKKL